MRSDSYSSNADGRFQITKPAHSVGNATNTHAHHTWPRNAIATQIKANGTRKATWTFQD
jgi:hypothetical protein